MGSQFAEWSDESRSPEQFSISLRPATSADGQRLNDIQAASSRSPIDLSRMLADPDRTLLVAEHAGHALGWAGIHLLRDADGPAGAGYYLAGIVVAPVARRHGVGWALTQGRLDRIWERADEAWYFANARNAVSIALHARFGFVAVGETASVHGAQFEGGRGLIFRAARPTGT